jgi:hypothetical protein
VANSELDILKAELVTEKARAAEWEQEYKSLEVGYNAQVQHARKHYLRAQQAEAELVARRDQHESDMECLELALTDVETANKRIAELEEQLRTEGWLDAHGACMEIERQLAEENVTLKAQLNSVLDLAKEVRRTDKPVAKD